MDPCSFPSGLQCGRFCLSEQTLPMLGGFLLNSYTPEKQTGLVLGSVLWWRLKLWALLWTDSYAAAIFVAGSLRSLPRKHSNKLITPMSNDSHNLLSFPELFAFKWRNLRQLLLNVPCQAREKNLFGGLESSCPRNHTAEAHLLRLRVILSSQLSWHKASNSGMNMHNIRPGGNRHSLLLSSVFYSFLNFAFSAQKPAFPFPSQNY